ncbi:1-(5-phosphoribosyl)-5-[(5-phosphoribosylamino)methylideneamino]imidazole-4-carboxamide isomerase [uncultured Muribaculum sp.]|uniref:1-(5-phosphoribosyl)-5-[(5- phosphoribosylamino)methylideneamino]imidazole-4- carboxamide isomerase n=1 Tax=uncultured Muribaculum sp. TaxID=1918613 RepID=UPI0025AEDD94|nr:1-(5-phosphoribosyl)-5-[(5-phosphoribosylamino)methylideneamino]imidazole-4-carboxamide isomerase [uncultured Muribaculum sp.]
MIEFIPAIDIIGGKCVRLTQGEYSSSTVYANNPLDMAMKFADAGCRRLHLVDLDGAKSNHIVNYKVLERIASRTNLIIDFGGGIKTSADAEIAFNSGASMITGGSIAVKNPDIFTEWINKYGPEKLILGADARNGKIAVQGWTDSSEIDIIPFITDYHSKGITQVISTDISQDGTLLGPSVQLYKDIQNAVQGMYVIASGGIGNIQHVKQLDEAKIPAVIVGKAIYEGKITFDEIEKLNVGNA